MSDVAWHDLRRPFAPAEVRFKVQTVLGDNKGATIASYIDARSVIDRLTTVAVDDWEDDYQELKGGVLCRLTVGARTRCDVGHSANVDDDTGFKGQYSDAFKRAAVKFGVGLFLYAMEMPKLWVGDGRDHLRKSHKGRPLVDEETLGYLRGGYEKWLQSPRGLRFGPPLEHFDVPFDAGEMKAAA